MANIPIPENDDSLELNVRYQPDMVLEGMLDATVPEMKYLRLSQGNDTYDLLGAQTGDQILELLSEDLTSAEEGKVLTVVEDDSGDTPVYNAEWADAPSGLPEITNSDEGKVLTVVDNSGTLEAEWAEPSGGEVVDLNVIATEVQTALTTAVGNAGTSGFFGVSLTMFGEETTVEIANLITKAARAGKISALNHNLTLTTSVIDDTSTPNVEGMEAYTSISFVIPFIAIGFNGYAIAVQIGTADKRDQQTDEYTPTLAVSCWAMKLINYPSNS